MYGQKFGRKFGKAAQNREKQEWAQEKPKLDNARRLRRIYFIGPDDEEYKEILKNARRNLERPMAAAMPCKRLPNSIKKVTAKPEIESEKKSKTVNGCMVESQESTRQRVESSQPKNHEDHIAGKGFTPMSHYNLGHNFIPMPQAMKILETKAAVEGKSRAKRRLFWKHKETKRKSTLKR